MNDPKDLSFYDMVFAQAYAEEQAEKEAQAYEAELAEENKGWSGVCSDCYEKPCCCAGK